jgi:hypothetical protein
MIRLGWEGLPGTNTLAYNEYTQIPAVKFYRIVAELKMIDTLTGSGIHKILLRSILGAS